MKTVKELRERLKNELDKWFIKQAKNPFEKYYLYYMKSTQEHDGGILIACEKPKNENYLLADPMHIRRDKTVEENCIMISNSYLNKLSVLNP